MSIQETAELIKRSKNIMVLTGAGMSAESGLPTFRGKDGYWIKDGKNYKPMELATHEFFSIEPGTVWEWYHHRRNVYSDAKPNSGHDSLVELQNYCKSNSKTFLVVTQNVDNLHQRSGISQDSMFEVHGNIYYMRCSESCTNDLYPIPLDENAIPTCPKCSAITRPHVLWFDEFYNEEFFNYRTVLLSSNDIDMLLIIGTTLQTNLPYQIFHNSIVRSIPIIEINIEPLGLERYGVKSLKGKVGEILPQILNRLNTS